MAKFTDKPSNNYTPSMMAQNIPDNSEYVSIQQAAKIIGCSNKRVYQYVREGRLPAERVGRIIILPRKDVQEFKPAPSGRTRTKTPLWQIYRSRNKFVATVIQVQVRAGMHEKLLEKFRSLSPEAHLFKGTVARYVTGDAGTVEISLIWKESEMPDEATRQQDLLLFQEYFADVLDWDTAHYGLKDVFLHT